MQKKKEIKIEMPISILIEDIKEEKLKLSVVQQDALAEPSIGMLTFPD